MKNRLLRLVMLTLVTGPLVGSAGPLGPILLPTGTGDGLDSTEIGEDPPPSPKDPGNVQPGTRTSELQGTAAARRADGSFGPVLLPTRPGEGPDSTEIGQDPPPSPKDPGDIQPESPLLTPGAIAIAARPVVGTARFSGPILWPTGPGDDLDSTEIGDKPPPDPTDEGGIWPVSSLGA